MKNASAEPNSHARGAAARFVDGCLKSGRYGFAIDEAMAAISLDARCAKDQLRRLSNRVVRVARWQSYFLIKGDADGATGAPAYDRWMIISIGWDIPIMSDFTPLRPFTDRSHRLSRLFRSSRIPRVAK